MSSSLSLPIHLLNLCIVCGQRANIQCDFKQFWFCGKEYKKEYLDAIADTDNVTSNHYEDEQIYCPSVYAESELVVEEEPTEAEEEEREGEGNDKKMLSMEETRSKSLFPNDHKNSKEDDDDDDNDELLEQADLNAMTCPIGGGTLDPITLDFYARIGRIINCDDNDCGDVKNQCLRYCRWPEVETMEDEDDTKDVIIKIGKMKKLVMKIQI